MVRTNRGPVPEFSPEEKLSPLAWLACPGKGVDYPRLYQSHYGRLPQNWLLGAVQQVRSGHAADPVIRRSGASGGVITAVLTYLLETGKIDAAILVRQGVGSPEEAGVVFAQTREEILAGAQSVYIPVANLDALRRLEPGKRYAMTCLPEQSAALRVLQTHGHEQARQIRYVLGPYTGTAMEPAAIRGILRSNGIKDEDAITRLQWRAGEWPGHLEIALASGRVVRSKKVYYNYLIPFFITQTSLQSMDFANEFADLAVGDAWSPRFEALGQGHSVFTTRSREMEAVVAEMEAQGLLVTESMDPLKASEMHGHMIDFKRRGGFIRNTWRRRLGLAAPDYGFAVATVPLSRYAVEAVISTIFSLARTRPARKILESIPESVMGPLFNFLRLRWKQLSKPTKRKGLGNLQMDIRPPLWESALVNDTPEGKATGS